MKLVNEILVLKFFPQLCHERTMMTNNVMANEAYSSLPRLSNPQVDRLSRNLYVIQQCAHETWKLSIEIWTGGGPETIPSLTITVAGLRKKSRTLPIFFFLSFFVVKYIIFFPRWIKIRIIELTRWCFFFFAQFYSFKNT